MVEETIEYIRFESPVGLLAVAHSNYGICAVHHGEEAYNAQQVLTTQFPEATIIEDAKMLVPAVMQMNEYLRGHRKIFDLTLDIRGGEFYSQVWEQIAEIPYSRTISYTELAMRVRRTSAVRAVGTACGKNPIPLIVPCHRVRAKDCSLGGFAWGLDVKRFLLDLEAGRETANLLQEKRVASSAARMSAADLLSVS